MGRAVTEVWAKRWGEGGESAEGVEMRYQRGSEQEPELSRGGSGMRRFGRKEGSTRKPGRVRGRGTFRNRGMRRGRGWRGRQGEDGAARKVLKPSLPCTWPRTAAVATCLLQPTSSYKGGTWHLTTS